MAGVVIWGLLGYFGYNYYHNWRKAAAKENVPRMNPNGNEWQDDETIWITKRFIYARLVYGIYDRFKRAERYEEWWTAMQYQRVKLAAVLSEDEQEVYKDALQYERTHKYFGVFQLTTNSPPANALKWVVAIRGTDFSRTADLLNNLSIVFEQLNSAQLTTIVEVVVRRLVAQHGYQSVGVTGHSLGAAVGLLVCRRLALERCLVEGHFFNPPFAHMKSLVQRLIPRVLEPTSDSVCYGIARLKSVLLDGDTAFQRAKREFKTLAEARWYPYLYVNEYDVLCNKYLKHFEHGSADDDPEKYFSSFPHIIFWETESFHLFPFAYLNTIRRERHIIGRFTAHKLRIWLRSDVPGRFQQVELIQRP
ncbi:hypothetical protein MARPO_0046s0047 [Marchantia polymorpha]|uniref:Fungal lipase-type domain-containing protein n=1 Tax=Marchantia polymorpha TaxID=3197 RepID=A0A2R6WZF7_MARPO|nr:hypothetical protein MARPO_0046s0047 [Marchantia polymorpha]|eukprot:PTQ39225.1 hypothetical protein MARPO_0046s0047 [Marchantia polymorpha]